MTHLSGNTQQVITALFVLIVLTACDGGSPSQPTDTQDNDQTATPTASAQQAEETNSSVPFHLLEATIDDVHHAFSSGEMTCRQLVELYIKRIEAYDKTGPGLTAVQTLNPNAIRIAEQMDETYQSSGLTGPLHCIPILVKDQVETSDMPTTYGSAIFEDFVPERDATVVIRLKQAGAIILGKTTMGEFAASFSGSAFGVVRNPYDPTRNPSGSSAGTGAGIAANFATVGIGEDTGGSIRGPAAVGSLVGLRPTVPLVSRHGMMPARPTSDTLGPITRTVRDAAILLDAIAGYDPNDQVTAYAVGQVPSSYTTFLRENGLIGARIGVIREPMDAKTDTDSDDYKKVRTIIDQAIGELQSLGAELVDPITIPDVQDRIGKVHAANVYETAEAIERYLQAHPAAPVKTLKEILLTEKVLPRRATQLMNNVGKSRDDAGYLDVLRNKEALRQLVLKLMADQDLDALVYATFDHQPAVIADDILTTPDPSGASAVGNNRRLSAALGFPAMTVPAGFTSDGLPVGMEFLARPFAEGTLLQLGYAYEQGTHHRVPPASTPPLQDEP
jgi:Asp-tRNA(Asn)/Glu-tRNA(Gln) amidotransferase A subunit family amidase